MDTEAKLKKGYQVLPAVFSVTCSLAFFLMLLSLSALLPNNSGFFPPWWEFTIALGIWVILWRSALRNKSDSALSGLFFIFLIYLSISFGLRNSFILAFFLLFFPVLFAALSVTLLHYYMKNRAPNKKNKDVLIISTIFGTLLGMLPIYVISGFFIFLATYAASRGWD